MNTKIEEIKRTISTTFEIPVEGINGETSTQTVERWDSIGHINLVMTLEQQFAVKFTTDEIMQMRDFGTLCRVIEAKNSAGNA